MFVGSIANLSVYLTISQDVNNDGPEALPVSFVTIFFISHVKKTS